MTVRLLGDWVVGRFSGQKHESKPKCQSGGRGPPPIRILMRRANAMEFNVFAHVKPDQGVAGGWELVQS
jgi:hypothetical protein